MSIALTAEEPRLSLPRRFIDLLPGLALLFAIGFSGKLIEQTINGYGKAHHLALPNIEYVLWAIVIGLIIANTIGVPKIFRPGIATYEFFLKLGIVLLGVRFLLGDVLKLGGISPLTHGGRPPHRSAAGPPRAGVGRRSGRPRRDAPVTGMHRVVMATPRPDGSDSDIGPVVKAMDRGADGLRSQVRHWSDSPAPSTDRGG